MATFSVRFLGCKVSHADAHAIREALLRDGHAERNEAEIAVVNTCCVTHEACLRRWQTKLGREDEVLVDRPGRGYGDDYSPWLVDGTAPVGELVRARAAAVTEEGIVGAL